MPVKRWSRAQREKFQASIKRRQRENGKKKRTVDALFKRRKKKFANGPTAILAMSDEGVVPFTPGETHVPDYYKLYVVPIGATEAVTIDVTEIVAQLPFLPACVVKHALRAGRKPGNSGARDAQKCAEYAQRWAQRTLR